MKILMLGWELPPHISGGLGVASEGIANGLSEKGHKVDFLIPKKKKGHSSSVFNIVSASDIKPDFALWKKTIRYTETLRDTEMGARLIPYLPAEVFIKAKERQVVVEKIEETEESELLKKIDLTGDYLESLNHEISKYALLAAQFSNESPYDAIHAHDWVTFKAGRMAAKKSGTPLFVHCHSTEYDRNGFHAQPFIINEEKLGFKEAKTIFCVSERLKKVIVGKYKIKAKKIVVVPNAVSTIPSIKQKKSSPKKEVVFVGRFTHQKSPMAFIDIARALVSKGIDCHFTMIGDGYLRGDLEDRVSQKNLDGRFDFTGFIPQGKALEKLSKADLLIVPSSAEPFGLVILEAISMKIPVAAATGTGVAEFIPSLPQAELWDHYNYEKLAERLLTDDALIEACTEACFKEASQLTWENSALKMEAAYHS
ncbi:MAG: glycosyltransferase family 4 protein [Cyclobacteriaceae bacterium]